MSRRPRGLQAYVSYSGALSFGFDDVKKGDAFFRVAHIRKLSNAACVRRKPRGSFQRVALWCFF